MAFERSPAPSIGRTTAFAIGRSMAEPFPEIVSALEQLPDGPVLDSELVVPAADGRSDFEQVRRRNLIQRPRMIQEGAAKSRHVTPGPRV